MSSYQTPGVFIEEVSSGARPIEGVATSIAAIIGKGNRGPFREPILVNSHAEYERAFGEIAGAGDLLGLAVQAFFQNGGRQAHVVRLASGTEEKDVAASAILEGSSNPGIVTIRASSVGTWGNELRVQVEKASAGPDSFTLKIGHDDDTKTFVSDETHANLSLDAASERYVVNVLKQESIRARASVATDKLTLQPASIRGAKLPDPSGNPLADTHLINWPEAGAFLTMGLDGRPPRRIDLPDRAKFPTEDPTKVAPLDTKRENNANLIVRALNAAVRGAFPTADFEATFVDGSFKLESRKQIEGELSPKLGISISPTQDQNDVSGLLKLRPADEPETKTPFGRVIPKATTGASIPLTGGLAGSPEPKDYKAFFETRLIKIRDASIIVLPGQVLSADGTGNAVIDAAIEHCEFMKNRMVILDLPENLELHTRGNVDALAASTSTYAAVYYPWIQVANPDFNPEKPLGRNPSIYLAPSAFAAGMWSRIDGRRGVWKAPAGVETQLLGAQGLKFDVGDGAQGQLNPEGINCIRRLGGYGRVIWGARTRSTRSNPEWRYVPIRRTAIYIEESIYNGIQWAVFEPNDHKLWSSLRTNIESFMNGLFRSGAFQGDKASDAYFVRCNLGDTMTQGDIDTGQVIVVVGFAPLKPAEFVIVRIQQKVGQE